MKERIRQILREETSGLNPKVISAAHKMMNSLTKDCLWYFDTPEQRFEYTPESIWLINPETKKWVLELDKNGNLWYNYGIINTFERYFNMEHSDFESFIKLWVEDALKRGVSTTRSEPSGPSAAVEDVLKIGVSKTIPIRTQIFRGVEYALKNGKKLR